MKYLFRIVFVLMAAGLVITLGAKEQPTIRTKPSGKAIYTMSRTDVDLLLQDMSRQNLTITQRINRWSDLFLGMPYSWTATGDGPYALYESYPLMSVDSTNCMVYCEHVLALAMSDSWDNFFNNLQQIRYENGIIGMRTRNHYTIADWLPENAWILKDVSADVGGRYTQKMNRTISHKKFFQGKGITDLRYVKPDRTISIDYVPLQYLPKVEDQVKDGDIVSLLLADRDDIFSAHMLMIVEKDGKKYFREASTSTYTTFETEYQDWCAAKGSWKKYAGMAFMRVKDEMNQPGKVILPWQIRDLK